MSILGKYPSLHGRRVGLSHDDQVVAKGGFVAGGGEKISIVYTSPDTVAVFDDFLGHQKLDTGGFWRPILGTDTGAEGAVGIASGLHGGVAAIKCSNNFELAAGGTGATTLSALVGTGRNFHASQGRMRMAARVRPNDTGSDGNKTIFVGFSDDTGTVEFPMWFDTGTKGGGAAGISGDLSAKASDAIGLLCSAISDTGLGLAVNKWTAVAVAGGTVTTAPVQADTGAVSEKWSNLEIVYDRGDTGGIAQFYVNGIRIGSITTPVATTAKLSPWIGIGQHTVDTGSTEMFVDWVNVSQARDTGD
jgi:hypothetical protein